MKRRRSIIASLRRHWRQVFVLGLAIAALAVIAVGYLFHIPGSLFSKHLTREEAGSLAEWFGAVGTIAAIATTYATFHLQQTAQRDADVLRSARQISVDVFPLEVDHPRVQIEMVNCSEYPISHVTIDMQEAGAATSVERIHETNRQRVACLDLSRFEVATSIAPGRSVRCVMNLADGFMVDLRFSISWLGADGKRWIWNRHEGLSEHLDVPVQQVFG